MLALFRPSCKTYVRREIGARPVEGGGHLIVVSALQLIRRSTVEVSTIDSSRAFAIIERNTWVLLACVTMLIAMVLLLWM